ncbi:MAG: hypothetical protein ACR2QX_06425 [Woeseiaceae bacterium]
MRTKTSFLLALIVTVLLGGCAAPATAPKSGVELQAYQAKEFETTKRAAFSATMSVFQDLGFIIDDGEFDTGLITATGLSIRHEMGMGDVFSKLFAGVDTRGFTERRATAFVEKMPSGLIRIRLNFVDNIATDAGVNSARVSKPVEDPVFYQATFERIDKAIFVRSGST